MRRPSRYKNVKLGRFSECLGDTPPVTLHGVRIGGSINSNQDLGLDPYASAVPHAVVEGHLLRECCLDHRMFVGTTIFRDITAERTHFPLNGPLMRGCLFERIRLIDCEGYVHLRTGGDVVPVETRSHWKSFAERFYDDVDFAFDVRDAGGLGMGAHGCPADKILGDPKRAVVVHTSITQDIDRLANAGFDRLKGNEEFQLFWMAILSAQHFGIDRFFIMPRQQAIDQIPDLIAWCHLTGFAEEPRCQ